MKKLTSNIRNFFKSRVNTVLVVVLVLIVLLGVFFIPKLLGSKTSVQLPLEETELQFSEEGPYAILEPRRDGNALILNIKRVAGFDKITYELAYSSLLGESEEGDEDQTVDRGVQGEIKDVDAGKSEYSQEILFGTCSKGDTFSTRHCVFDQGVENGTLTLKIFQKVQPGDKTQKVYRFSTPWYLQKPDVALGKITSGDNHFNFLTKAARVDLNNVGFTLTHDLSSAPKLDQNSKFVGKVYAFNVPTAKKFPNGLVSIELAENVPDGAKLARFDTISNSWQLLDSKVDKSILQAEADGSGIFAVVTSR